MVRHPLPLVLPARVSGRLGCSAELDAEPDVPRTHLSVWSSAGLSSDDRDLDQVAGTGGWMSSSPLWATAARSSPPPATVTVGKANSMPLTLKAFLIMA
jgi:hypothetical protein